MKYKIIQLLRTFSEKETRQFDNFLSSPYLNESRKVSKLYKSLLKYYPDFDCDLMSEEKLSKEVNPNLPYNKSTIKALFFQLGNSADEFLKISNLRKRKADAEDMLREEYFKRGLNKFAKINADKCLEELNTGKKFDSLYFHSKHKIMTDMCNYFKISVPKSNSGYINDYSKILCERAKYITNVFLIEILEQYSQFQTFKRNFYIDEENNFVIQLFEKFKLEECLGFVIKSSKKDNYSLIFELHLANLKIFSNPENEKYYHDYKKLLIKNLDYLEYQEINFHFIKLISYCMIKLNDNPSGFDFRKELFSINKFILYKEYYKAGVQIFLPVELYRTVLKLGLEMKKFNWTLKFIKECNPKLQPEKRENMYNYSLAEYYFHKKNFDKALRYIHEIELSHFMLRVDLKNLMLMTFYELDLFENALLLVDSYKHFISNTTMLSDSEKIKCRNFIAAVQSLIKYRTTFKSNLKNLINAKLSENIYNKIWIQEKFQSLDIRVNESA